MIIDLWEMVPCSTRSLRDKSTIGQTDDASTEMAQGHFNLGQSWRRKETLVGLSKGKEEKDGRRTNGLASQHDLLMGLTMEDEP